MLHDSLLTEDSALNAFVVKDGLILTSPANRKILSGITRRDDWPVGNGRQARLAMFNVYKKRYAAFCEYRNACCMKEKHV